MCGIAVSTCPRSKHTFHSDIAASMLSGRAASSRSRAAIAAAYSPFSASWAASSTGGVLDQRDFRLDGAVDVPILDMKLPHGGRHHGAERKAPHMGPERNPSAARLGQSECP